MLQCPGTEVLLCPLKAIIQGSTGLLCRCHQLPELLQADRGICLLLVTAIEVLIWALQVTV